MLLENWKLDKCKSLCFVSFSTTCSTCTPVVRDLSEQLLLPPNELVLENDAKLHVPSGNTEAGSLLVEFEKVCPKKGPAPQIRVRIFNRTF